MGTPFFRMPRGGLEPPQALTPTGSLVLRVYQFHHLGLARNRNYMNAK